MRSRASFLDPSRHVEPDDKPGDSTPARARLQARRRTAGEPGGAAPQQAPGIPEPRSFVFETPGAPAAGQKAARSSRKKTAHKGHTPLGTPFGTPYEGSPMQWSPMDSQAWSDQLSGTPGSAGPRAAPAAEGRWAQVGSNANIANGAATAAAAPAGVGAADPIAVELMTRLHLSGTENLPQELQSRLNLSPGGAAAAAQPAKQAAGSAAAAGGAAVGTDAAAAAAAELASRLRHVHVAGAEDLAQKFKEQVSVGAAATAATSGAPAAAAAAAAPGEAAQPQASPSEAGAGQAEAAAPARFVFTAGGPPRSPAQRQVDGAPSAGRPDEPQGRERAADGAAGLQPESAAAAGVPSTAGQAPAPGAYVFGAQQPPAAAAAPAPPSRNLPPPPRFASPPQPAASAASAVFGSSQPAAAVSTAESAAAPSAPPSFIFGGSQPAPAQPSAPPPFVFGGSQPAPAQPSTPLPFVFGGSKPFVFGGSKPEPVPAQPSVPPPFAFGGSQPAPTQPSAPPPFVFGGSQPEPAPAQPSMPPSFAFGGSQPAPAATSTVPSFVFASQPAAGGSGASGSSASEAPPFPQQGQQGMPPAPAKGAAAARRLRRKSVSPSPSQPPQAQQGLAAGGFLPAQPGAALFGQPGAAGGSPGKAQPQPVVLPDLSQELAASAASELHRSQGNEAFKAANYEAALELYTKAIKALWPCPNLHPRLAPLLSNRAAALLSLGKPFQALKDCQMGLKYNPAFSRCALRIATCHYRLGDFAAAEQHLRGMEHTAAGDPALLAEIAAKLEEVKGHRERMLAALERLGHSLPASSSSSGGGSGAGSRAPSAAARGQGSGAEALQGALSELELLWAHVPHAEYLHAAKAQALLRLGKFPEAVQASKAPVHYDTPPSAAPGAREPWRLWVEVQCAYHKGDYVATVRLAQQLLQQQQRRQQEEGAAAGGAGPFGERAATPPATQGAEGESAALLEAVVPLPSAAQLAEAVQSAEAAQHLRQQGNELMKQRKYKESLAKYTEALALPGLSAAFASILHSNRAAAHQGQQQWVQAVADCCRSRALVPAFAKAHSRLAVLLSELRMHAAAARALEAALAAPGLPGADRRDYEARLREARHAAQRSAGPRLMGSGGGARQADHYKLLALERGCSVEEVRKAYKRLALQMHPDKAVSSCRFSARLTECGAEVVPAAEAQGRLQEDAKWLFQALGEAHEVLADKSRRQELDYELAEERCSGGPDPFGASFAGGERRYGPGAGNRYGQGGYGQSSYSYGGFGGGYYDFAERVRRAAQQRQQAGGRAGPYSYGPWSGF